ncbi:MAG: FAD-dependent oxidoreductase, partial [Polyangiaceae bacterium]|nr:FAD-dependent oxidoreductase [Polyangiaceae bacterium]
SKTVRVRDLRTGESRDDRYDFLVLSPGAKPIAPPIPGIDHPKVMTLRNMADMDRLRAAADAGAKRAVVVGGGYIGIEMAENLVARGVQVTLVEMAKQVLTFLDPEMAELAHGAMRERGVELRLGDRVVELRSRAATGGSSSEGADSGDGSTLDVVLASGAALPADLVVLAIGVTPEVTLARDAGLQLGPSSAIAVDERMRTSAPSIFAVGDAAEVTHFVTKSKARIPLAGPANRQGRVAANNICGIPSTYAQTQGTSIIQVFELVCAATGASAALLRASGVEFKTVRVHGKSHAGYYPGAETVHLTVHYAPGDGRLLGAQACGVEGIDKRIDVLAVGMRHGATVYDLEDYELSYAPPFGSAKDPINMVGFA